MADEMDDKSQKTEEPTERKLEEARKKGNVAATKEMGIALSTIGMMIVLAFIAPIAGSGFVFALMPFIEQPDKIMNFLSVRDVSEIIRPVVIAVIIALAPVFLVLIFMAILAIRLQGEIVISVERIKPKLQNISLIKGFTRIYSISGFMEFIKSILKVAIVLIAGWIVLSSEASQWISSVYITPDGIMEFAGQALVKLFLFVAVAMVAITILDFIWKRFDHRRKLKMSMRELKEEHKQSEGDPLIKAKLSEMRRSRSRKRMMAAVPTATVVVANPTHYAVALKYDQGIDEAPLCVAKGVDAIALKIREVAEESEVPVVENPALARTLYASIEVDQTIPYEYFKAVAEVISYVYQQQGKRSDFGE